MSEIQTIKEKINLVEHISKRFQTRRVGGGSYRVNPCPLCGHNDCFTISEKRQTWKCYSCDNGGDVFEFEILTSKRSFGEVLSQLAKETGVELKKGKENQKQYESRKQIEEIFVAAVEYYHGILQKTQKALKYLKEQRKRDNRTIKKARYGYSDGLLHKFLSEKYKKEILLKTGLVKQDQTSKNLYDHFKKGLFIYPIYYNSRVVDFFAKDYFGDKKQLQLANEYKLSNPPFYGKNALFRDEFTIVEGQEDRLSVLQHYDMPTVATMGNLSGQQIDFIADHCEGKKILMGFDPDHEGKKYERKLLDAISGKAILMKLVWDEEQGDIDDYIKNNSKSKERIKEMIDTAQDAIMYYINKMPDVTQMPPHIMQGYWEPICKWIAGNPNEVIRLSYMNKLADKIGGKTRFLQPIKNTIYEIRTGKAVKEKSFDIDQEWGIGETANRYYRLDPEKGNKKVSEFVLRIHKYIEMNDEIYYECSLINSKGIKSNPIIFDSKDRVNKRQFREKCGTAGSYYFMGNDIDLVEIWQREETKAKIESRTCYFQRYGFVAKHNIWLFDNCAVQNKDVYLPDDDGVIAVGNIGYHSKNVNVYSGDAPFINLKFRANRDYILDIMKHFRIMFDDVGGKLRSFKGFLVFGYIAAMVYLPEFVKYDRKFPFILVYGPSGSGKSEALQLMMNCLGFTNGGENWGEATPAGISMAVEQLSNLPYWMEEFKNVMGINVRQQKKIELVNNIYTRTGAGKGGLENRSSREVNGAILFTGQDRPEDKAFLSRAVVIDKEHPTDKATDSYFHLRSERKKLSSIFLHLIEEKTPEKCKRLIEYLEEYRTEIRRIADKEGYKSNIDERSIFNYCILAAAFSNGFEYHEHDTEFIKWLASEIIEDVKRKNQEDVLFRFFEDIEVIFDSIYDVVKKEGGILYLNFNKIFHEWKKAGARIGMSEYMSKNGLIDYMKKDTKGYWMGKSRTYFGTKQDRVILLKVDKLPDNIKEIVESWLEGER